MSHFLNKSGRGSLLLVLSVLTMPLAAADDDQELADLGTITVTATRTEQSVFESARSVTVVSAEDLRKASAESLAEALRDVPGVTILDNSVPGMKRIEIRGESSRRNVIMIDGQEITDHSSYGTPLLIDTSAVQRVEVVRGPSSVLYGSKAIGGVINIITKQGSDRPIEGELSGTYFSATNGHHFGGTLIGAVGNWDYRVTGSVADHDDRETAEGTLEGSSFSTDSLSGHLGYRSGKHYFAVKAERYDLESDSYVDPAVIGFPVVGFDLNFPQRDRRKIGVFYDAVDISDSLSKIHFDAYHQTVDRLFEQELALSFGGPAGLTQSNVSVDDGTTRGATLQFDFKPHPDHLLIVGGQYQDDELDVEKTSTQTILPAPGFPMTTVTTDLASIKTASVYVQDEWAMSEDFNLLAGLRYYDVSAELEESNHVPLTTNDDNELLGNLGLTYTGLENQVLRFFAGQGYVYPTLLQLFIDTPFGAGGITFGNPELKPETSDSIEFGWRYSSDSLVLDATAFYSTAEQYIDRVPLPGGPNLIWVNIDEARTYGAEFLLQYYSGGWANMTPYINGTWLRRKFITPNYSTYDTFTPSLSGRLGVRFDVTARGWGDLFIRGSTSADLEQNGVIVESSDSWATVNLWLGMDLGKQQNFQLSVHFNNIFDEDYRPPNELPGIGRSFDLTARVLF